MDLSLISKFNQAQMDPLNLLHGVDSSSDAAESQWLGELGGDSGETLACPVLVGPLTGNNPTVEKEWDSIILNGKGRAMAIVWIDSRKVASGMLNMEGGPGEPNRLPVPVGLTNGYTLTALIVFHGNLLSCKAFYD